MKVGRRLAMKVLNASKFVLGSVGATALDPAAVTEPVDRAMLAGLAARSSRGHRRVRGLRLHHRARGRPSSSSGSSATTTSSWSRSGRTAPAATTPAASAKAALAIALHVQLRLLAPFLPYVTEEVWSWWQDGLDPPARPGRPPAELGDAAGGRPGDAGRRGRRRCAASAAPSRGQGVDAHRAVPGHGRPVPPTRVALAEQAADDLKAAGKITGDLAFTPADGRRDHRRRRDRPGPRGLTRRVGANAACFPGDAGKLALPMGNFPWGVPVSRHHLGNRRLRNRRLPTRRPGRPVGGVSGSGVEPALEGPKS